VREQRAQHVAMPQLLVDRAGEREHEHRDRQDQRIVELEAEMEPRDERTDDGDHQPHDDRQHREVVRQRLRASIDDGRGRRVDRLAARDAQIVAKITRHHASAP